MWLPVVDCQTEDYIKQGSAVHCARVCCPLIFPLATCMTEQNVKLKKHTTLLMWITKALLFQKCCHERSRSIERCSQNNHPALKNLQLKCRAELWRNWRKLYTIGEHLEREMGMFYNGSFNETERDNKKHQKKGFFRNKENVFHGSGGWAGCGTSMLWSQRQTNEHEDTWLYWSSSVKDRQTRIISNPFLSLSFHMILKSEKGARQMSYSLTLSVLRQQAQCSAMETYPNSL